MNSGDEATGVALQSLAAARVMADRRAVKTGRSPQGYAFVPVDDMIALGATALSDHGLSLLFHQFAIVGTVATLTGKLWHGKTFIEHVSVSCDHTAQPGLGPCNAGGSQAYLMAMAYRMVLSIAKVEQEPDAAKTVAAVVCPQVGLISEMLTFLGYELPGHVERRLRDGGLSAASLGEAGDDELNRIVDSLMAEKGRSQDAGLRACRV